MFTVFGFGQSGEKNLSKGDALLLKGNYQKALVCYKDAVQCFDSTANNSQAIICNNKAALCYSRLGQFEEANTLLSKDLDILQNLTIKNLTEEANTLKLLGEVALNMANYERALDLFKQEKALFTDKTNNDLKATNLSNLGIASDQIGNHDIAVDYLEQAIILQSKTDDKTALANSYNNLGLIHSSNNESKALEAYQNALSIYDNQLGKEHPSYINTNNNIAIIHKKMGDTDKALSIFEKTLQTWIKAYGNEHPSVAFSYSNIGQVYLDFNLPDSALSYEFKALKIYEKTYGSHHPELANTHNHISNIYRTKGEIEDAIFHAHESILTNCKDFKSEDINNNPLPNVTAYNRQLLAVSLHQKAQLFSDLHYKKTLKQGDLKRAFKTLEACDAIIDEQRHFLKNKKDKLTLGSLSKEVHEDAISIALAMADNSVKNKNNFYEKAFLYSEKSKAAVLLESMNDANAKSFANLPKEVLEKETKLVEEINLINQKLSIGNNENELSIRQKLNSLTEEHQTLVKELEQKYPAYYDLKYNIKMSSVKELQALLKDNQCIYSYFIAEGKKRLYIFTISKSNFTVYNTPLNKDFDRLITGYRNSIYYQAPKEYAEISYPLFKQLFPKKINKKIDQLIIIPDGRLGLIPLEALLQKNIKKEISFNSLPYLINDYTTNYTFSATLYAREKAKEKVITKPNISLTAPVSFNTMSDLPGSKVEVEKIQQLFSEKQLKHTLQLENNATETAVKNGTATKGDILHFATHGIVKQENPELSQIFLKEDAENDGNLYTSEIYSLKLNASLVNLSACQTGLGQYSKGEGVVGLSRALIYAGAQNLIVSYWKVSDESTSQLMISFYKNHLEGKNYATSLRNAKLELIKKGEFNHPYYWAPFVLIGQ